MSLASLMRRSLVTVTPDMRIAAATLLAAEKRAHHLVVVQNHDVVGILCVCDLHEAKDPSGVVGDCMSMPVRTVSVNDSPAAAAATMREHLIGCLPVTAGALLVGVVCADDLAAAGISLADLGRRRCDACGSALHVRSTRHDPEGALCLYCRERAHEREDTVDTGGGD